MDWLPDNIKEFFLISLGVMWYCCSLGKCLYFLEYNCVVPGLFFKFISYLEKLLQEESWPSWRGGACLQAKQIPWSLTWKWQYQIVILGSSQVGVGLNRTVPKRWGQRGALNKSLNAKMRRSQPQVAVLKGPIREINKKPTNLEEKKKRKDSMID